MSATSESRAFAPSLETQLHRSWCVTGSRSRTAARSVCALRDQRHRTRTFWRRRTTSSRTDHLLTAFLLAGTNNVVSTSCVLISLTRHLSDSKTPITNGRISQADRTALRTARGASEVGEGVALDATPEPATPQSSESGSKTGSAGTHSLGGGTESVNAAEPHSASLATSEPEPASMTLLTPDGSIRAVRDVCPGHDCPAACGCGGKHRHELPTPRCNYMRSEQLCPANCYGDDPECSTCHGSGLAQPPEILAALPKGSQPAATESAATSNSVAPPVPSSVEATPSTNGSESDLDKGESEITRASLAHPMLCGRCGRDREFAYHDDCPLRAPEILHCDSDGCHAFVPPVGGEA